MGSRWSAAFRARSAILKPTNLAEMAKSVQIPKLVQKRIEAKREFTVSAEDGEVPLADRNSPAT
jgi:hypothetical protein